MNGLLDGLTRLSPTIVYLTVAALVFAEDALFIGFVLPGETAAIIGGVTASLGHTHLSLMIATVVVAAILGDTVGYAIGHLRRTRLLDHRYLDRHCQRITTARTFLARRGGPAGFLGRFVAFLRATMPFIAGASHMRYRTFLAFNAAGGLIWGSAIVVLGYLAGTSYQKAAAQLGTTAALIVAAVAVVALIMWRINQHQRRPR
jgi:membrane-associated protein